MLGLITYSAKCGNRRPGMGASLFVQVQSLPDFSLSHLLEGINTQVLKRFVSKRNMRQAAAGQKDDRQTHTADGQGKGRTGDRPCIAMPEELMH